MAVQGTLLLPIDIKGVTYKMPFTLINSPVSSLIIGTPGLRMLKFSLYSPLFGKINYLKHPSLRNKIDKSAEEQDDSGTEQEEQKAKVLRKQQPAPDATTASDREVEPEAEKSIRKEDKKKGVKKTIYKKKIEVKTKNQIEEKRGRGRPKKNPDAPPKAEKEIKDPMVRALLGQQPLTSQEEKQDFQDRGAVKKK
jgi:hypothetical protein